MSALKFGAASVCVVAMLALSACTAVPGVVPAHSQGSLPMKHIVFLALENGSLDHYFGAMRLYWAQNGYPDQSFDGLPQFTSRFGDRPPFSSSADESRL